MSTPSPHRWDDAYVEQVIGNLLRFGVSIAAGVMLVGGIAYLWHSGSQPADDHTFHGEPGELCTLSGIVTSAAHLEPRGIMQLAVLLLIATPIARVAVSIYAFERQHDRLYVFITLVVLVILVYSLVTETGH